MPRTGGKTYRTACYAGYWGGCKRRRVGRTAYLGAAHPFRESFQSSLQQAGGDEGRERLKLLRRTVQGDHRDVVSLTCGAVERKAKTGERFENAIYYYTRLFRFKLLGEKTAVTAGSRIKVSIFITAFGASVNVHLHIAKFYCHWSVLVALRCFLCVKE